MTTRTNCFRVWTYRMQRWAAVLAFTSIAVVALLTPMQAQTRAAETRLARPYYDLTREVTHKATVSSVLTKPSAGMIVGSHLLLATASGEVDASLGRWGLQGKSALSVSAGEPVGVMLMGRQVFVVRTVKVRGQVFAMRNEHGIPVSPQARERASQESAQKGESL